jgi:hypothetical protein
MNPARMSCDSPTVNGTIVNEGRDFRWKDPWARLGLSKTFVLTPLEANEALKELFKNETRGAISQFTGCSVTRLKNDAAKVRRCFVTSGAQLNGSKRWQVHLNWSTINALPWYFILISGFEATTMIFLPLNNTPKPSTYGTCR